MGHIITVEGVRTELNKIAVMVRWPEPRNLKELGGGGVLGLSGYYRKFVKEYALTSKPLTSLLKKGAFA